MFKNIREILAVSGTLYGLFLISNNDIILGFTISAIANILWIWHGHDIPEGGKGIIFVNTALFFIALNGMGVI